jgi:hypothetical protein
MGCRGRSGRPVAKRDMYFHLPHPVLLTATLGARSQNLLTSGVFPMSRREHGTGHNGRVNMFLTVGAIKPTLAFLLRHAFSLCLRFSANSICADGIRWSSAVIRESCSLRAPGQRPSAKVSKTAVRAGTGPRRGVPGEQWAATVFCRHCRTPEPLVCHWVAPGECLVEGNADPGAFPRTKDPLGSRSEATTHPFVS